MAQSAWASSSARLGRDSFLSFGSCSLCLQSAVDPVACSLGDIFCRECALSNILAQKNEIKRAEKAREHEEKEAADLKARQDEEAQARAAKEFEMVQLGFDVGGRGSGASAGDSSFVDKEATSVKRGEKRKFSLDDEEVSRNAESERAKARKAIDDEKVGLTTHARLNHFRTILIAYFSSTERETDASFILGTLGYTNIKFERYAARSQEEVQDLTHLSFVTTK